MPEFIIRNENGSTIGSIESEGPITIGLNGLLTVPQEDAILLQQFLPNHKGFLDMSTPEINSQKNGITIFMQETRMSEVHTFHLQIAEEGQIRARTL